MIVGGFAFLILGSVGVTFVTARNREERLLVPVKYASDLALLRKMSGKDNTENSENIEKDTL